MSQTVDLNKIRFFLKIIEAGNISRASELLNIPKAKLSRNLALLERELGTQLVYRTTRQFKLTDVGRAFFENTKSHFDHLDQTIKELKYTDEEVSGTIKLTAPEDIGAKLITKIVEDFSKLYPKVTFELIYTNETLDLVKLGVDLAIRVGQQKDSSLIQKKVGHIELIVVAAPGFLDKHSALIKPEQLGDFNTLGFGSNKSRLTWNLLHQNQLRSVTVKPRFLANNYPALLDLALHGHGIALAPKFLCEPYLLNGQLTQILKSFHNVGTPIQIVIPQQKNIPTSIRKFFDFSAKRLAEIFT